MTRVCPLVVLCVGMSLPASAQQYQARRDGDVVRLEDTQNQVTASILPSVGNQAFELKVKEHNVLLRWTYASVADFQSPPGMAGVPFLAPWPDILDEQAFLRQRTAVCVRHAAWQRPRSAAGSRSSDDGQPVAGRREEG